MLKTIMQGLIGALYLEPNAESLPLCCYLNPLPSRSERVNGSAPCSLLGWWASRLHATQAFSRIVVVCHSRREADAISVAVPDGIVIWRTRYFSKIHALSELTSAMDLEHLAVVGIGAAFGFRDLPGKLYEHHINTGNDVTLVNAIPDGAFPAIFRATSLANLATLSTAGLPSDPVVLVQQLVEASKAANQALDLRVDYWQPINSYESGFQAPWSVTVNTSNAGFSAKVAGSLDPGYALEGPTEGIKRWKEFSMRESLERRRALRSAVCREPPTVQDSPRRVLFVSNPAAFSGAEESLCQLLEAMDRKRYLPVALVSLEGHFAARLRKVGVEVIIRGESFGEPTVNDVLYLTSVLRDVRPAIVHDNSVSGLPVLIAATFCNTPLVQHVRNGVMAPYTEALRNADAVIVISDFLRREVLRFDVEASRIHLVPDEVNTSYFRPGVYKKSDARQELGIPQNSSVAVMIARLAPNKRHDLMLRATPIIKRAIPSFHLLLKGEVYRSTHEFALWNRRLASPELRDSVTWIPFVPDIRTVHAAADLLVLCSDREGLGRCIVEAMAMEVPVVVTDSGGSHELLGPGLRGFVTKAGDPEALAASVIEALSSPELCRRMQWKPENLRRHA
jgi:glycosyltransferase involved in cell wall biosynthesis